MGYKHICTYTYIHNLLSAIISKAAPPQQFVNAFFLVGLASAGKFLHEQRHL